MSKFQSPINEMKRAAATALLTVGIASAFFGVMRLDTPPSAKEVEVATAIPALPTARPAAGAGGPRTPNSLRRSTAISARPIPGGETARLWKAG